MLAVAAVGTGTASAGATPASRFVAFTRAEGRGDASGVCALLSDRFFERRAGELSGKRVDHKLAAKLKRRCRALVRGELRDMDPAYRHSFASAHVVKVATHGPRTRVTMAREVFGLTVRAAGRAVVERGRWRISEPLSHDHSGSELLLQIPSGSMLPTLEVGFFVLNDRSGYRHRAPALGDIVVFHPPPDPDAERCGVKRRRGQGCPPPDPDAERCGVKRRRGQGCPRAVPGASALHFIKRIVGLPGDRLAIVHGRVIRNGQPADEPFTAPCSADGLDCELPTQLTVPRGRYFVMGDNRGESSDSREFGPISKAMMIGPVRAVPPVAARVMGRVGYEEPEPPVSTGGRHRS